MENNILRVWQGILTVVNCERRVGRPGRGLDKLKHMLKIAADESINFDKPAHIGAGGQVVDRERRVGRPRGGLDELQHQADGAGGRGARADQRRQVRVQFRQPQQRAPDQRLACSR